MYVFKGKKFSLQFFLIFSLKIYNTTMDPDPYWAKILDTDPISMYLDPQHWVETKSALE